MLLEHWASSRENWCWTGVLSPLLHPGYKECGRGLEDHFLIGWGPYTGLGKSKVNNLSLCGVGEETGYTIQKDMKSINSYKTREGRTKRSVFSVPAFQDSLFFFLFFLSSFLTLGHYIFQWISYWHQVGKVLEIQLTHQSFQWLFRNELPYNLCFKFLLFKGLSRVFLDTTVQKH